MFLAKSSKVNIKTNRLRSLCVGTYKSMNSINLSFMNKGFRLRVTNRAVCSEYRLNLDITQINRIGFANKSIIGY